MGRRALAEAYLAEAEMEVERNALPVASILNTLLRSAVAAASGRFTDATRLTSAAIEKAGRAPTMTALMLTAQTLSCGMEQGRLNGSSRHCDK